MKIMVCHEGSKRSQYALEKTIELFKSQKPEIILITVVEEPGDATSHDEESFEQWRNSRDKDLKKAAEWVVQHGLDVDAILAIGDPRKMIVEAADSKNPDLIVVGRHATMIEKVIGTVSSYIIKHADCPVLVMNT